MTPLSKTDPMNRAEARDARNATRDALVFTAACTIALREGLPKLTRGRVAEEIGMSVGSVTLSYGSFQALIDAVIEWAIVEEHVQIVADALADKNPVAKTAPKELKVRALQTLL
jgi:AcrR family transcriptional regulator